MVLIIKMKFARCSLFLCAIHFVAIAEINGFLFPDEFVSYKNNKTDSKTLTTTTTTSTTTTENSLITYAPNNTQLFDEWLKEFYKEQNLTENANSNITGKISVNLNSTDNVDDDWLASVFDEISGTENGTVAESNKQVLKRRTGKSGFDTTSSVHDEMEKERIRLDFIKTLSETETVDGFVSKYVDVTGITLIRRSMLKAPIHLQIMKNAACKPENATVQVINTTDPNIVYVPSCTRIERCGGCCNNERLACQPIKTEKVSFKVYKTEFVSSAKAAKKLKAVAFEEVHVERHLKCKCGCKIKLQDCNELQEYRPNECMCYCVNSVDKEKCSRDGNAKMWNVNTCKCECRTKDCSAGYNFNRTNCKCEKIQLGFRSDGTDNVSVAKTHSVIKMERNYCKKMKAKKTTLSVDCP